MSHLLWQVQKRVSGLCGVGEFIKSINQDGTVVCAIDASGLSTVSSADIVDGAIQQIDLGSNVVGQAKVIASEVQLRIGGTCDDGLYLNGINQDGSVICKKLPIGLDFTLDHSQDVGLYTSMAIGSDNIPIISYYDATNQDLMVYKCSNISCSVGVSIRLDTTGDVGKYSSIAIGDNNPFISYYDMTNHDLKLYICSNASCSTGSAKVIDSTDAVGSYPSIAIGANNTPVISYYDITNGDLSYGGGRYVEVKYPTNDSVWIDFNKAYNPYCAYNHHYSCPIPPLENSLTISIKAGEKVLYTY